MKDSVAAVVLKIHRLHSFSTYTRYIKKKNQQIYRQQHIVSTTHTYIIYNIYVIIFYANYSNYLKCARCCIYTSNMVKQHCARAHKYMEDCYIREYCSTLRGRHLVDLLSGPHGISMVGYENNHRGCKNISYGVYNGS